MSSYLITGASRGLGFEFLRQLSENAANTVIGLVRDKAATDEAVADQFPRKNVSIVEGDLASYESLKKAVAEIERITGGSLDHVIANAAIVSEFSAYKGLGDLGADKPIDLEDDLTTSFHVNVVGNIHLFNLLMPQIRKGAAKKVITISSGMADLDLITRFDIANSAPYSISKGAMNVAVAKFSAEYQKDGILFMSISPGVVDTGHMVPEEHQAAVADLSAKFVQYAPHFTRPMTPAESVHDVMNVINKASIETGSAGAFVSHLGNKQWL